MKSTTEIQEKIIEMQETLKNEYIRGNLEGLIDGACAVLAVLKVPRSRQAEVLSNAIHLDYSSAVEALSVYSLRQ